MTLRAFHPTVQSWFAERLGEPSAPQRRGWPAIASGACRFFCTSFPSAFSGDT